MPHSLTTSFVNLELGACLHTLSVSVFLLTGRYAPHGHASFPSCPPSLPNLSEAGGRGIPLITGLRTVNRFNRRSCLGLNALEAASCFLKTTVNPSNSRLISVYCSRPAAPSH